MPKIHEDILQAFRDALCGEKVAFDLSAIVKSPAIRRAIESSGALGRFGQRQVHSLTGWTPKAGLESIRGGAWGEKDNFHKLVDAIHAGKGKGEDVSKLQKGLSRSLDEYQVAKDFESRGLTSIPGVARGVYKDPKGTFGSLAAGQWKGQNALGKASLLFAPASIASAALSSDEDGGRGKGERVGGSIGSFIGSAAGAGVPLVGQTALGMGGAFAGANVGKLVDKLRAKRPSHLHPGYMQDHEQPTSNGPHMPSERIVSDRAQGIVPEGVG